VQYGAFLGVAAETYPPGLLGARIGAFVGEGVRRDAEVCGADGFEVITFPVHQASRRVGGP
jgi:hypothetical protein